MGLAVAVVEPDFVDYFCSSHKLVACRSNGAVANGLACLALLSPACLQMVVFGVECRQIGDSV